MNSYIINKKMKNLSKLRFKIFSAGSTHQGKSFQNLVRTQVKYIKWLKTQRNTEWFKSNQDYNLLIKFYKFSKIKLDFTLEIYDKEKARKEQTKRFFIGDTEFRLRKSVNIRMPRYIISTFANQIMNRITHDNGVNDTGYYRENKAETSKGSLPFSIFVREINKYADNGNKISKSLGIWTNYADLFTIINIRQAIKSSSIPYIEPIHMKLKDDVKKMLIPKLISQYIDYEVLGEVYRNPFVKSNFIPKLCVFTNIINIFRNEQNKGQSSIYDLCTYENLAKFFFGNKFTIEDLQKRGISLSEIEPLFKKYKISLNIFDVNMKKTFELKYESSSVRPSSVYFVVHNNHLYELNANKDLIKHLKVNHSVISDNSVPMLYLNLPKEKKEDRIIRVLDNLESKHMKLRMMLWRKMIESDINNDKKIEYVVNEYMITGIVLYFWTYTGYEPIIKSMNGSRIQSVMIGKNIYIRCYSTNNGNLDFYGFTEKYVNKVLTLMSDLKAKFMRKEYLSFYNMESLELLKTYKPTPLRCSFNVKGVKKYIEFDQKKYYSSIVAYYLKFIPVMNQFDCPLKYDGHKIRDYWMYFVKKIDESIISFPLMKKYSLCFGINIKDCLDNFEIIGYITIGGICDSVGLNNAVLDIYKSDIEEHHKKLLCNSNIGCLSQDHITKVKGCFTTSLQEAKNIYDNVVIREIGKQIINEGEEETKNIFMALKTSNYQLKSGFLPFGHLIVETASKKCFDLYKDLLGCGFNIVSINVDCVCVEYDEQKLNYFKEKFRQHYFNGDGILNELKINIVDKTNQWELYNCKQNKPYEFKNTEYTECSVVTLDSEKDWKRKPGVFKKDVKKLFDENQIIFVSGSAGCGKSFSIKNYDDKTLFIVPTTELRGTYSESHISCTFDHFFNAHIKRDGSDFEISDDAREKVEMFQESYNLDNFNNIVFEEVGLLDIRKMSIMTNFIRQNKHKYKFFVCGDFYQNDPIHETYLNNIVNKENHKEKIIKSICDIELHLQINKRDFKKENKKHYLAIRQFVISNDLDAMLNYILKNCKVISRMEDIPSNIQFVLTTSNFMAKVFSKYLHKDKGYYKGLELIYKHEKSHIGKKRFYKNDRYTIKNITNDLITLSYRHLPNDLIILSKKDVEKHFILPYANTGFSKQGGTCDYPYLIDLSEMNIFPSAKRLYTTLSRASCWDNIHIYYDFTQTEKISKNIKNTINNMIMNHKRVDFEKFGKIYDDNQYVNYNWVMDKLKNGSCCICNNPFDIDPSSMGCFSIDRINNEIGHLERNCQLLHRYCNIIKR